MKHIYFTAFFCRFSGFYWLLQEEPALKAKKFKTVQEIVAGTSNVETALTQLSLKPEDILEVANSTVGQRNNSLWHQMRFGRLTASNFGVVISAIKLNRYVSNLYKYFMKHKQNAISANYFSS